MENGNLWRYIDRSMIRIAKEYRPASAGLRFWRYHLLPREYAHVRSRMTKAEKDYLSLLSACGVYSLCTYQSFVPLVLPNHERRFSERPSMKCRTSMHPSLLQLP